MPDNNQYVKSSEVTSYAPVPAYLKDSITYWGFGRIMRSYSTLSIVVAVIVGLMICGILLGQADFETKIFQCHLSIYIGVLVCGGSISKKKVPDAISMCMWGFYSLVTGVALTRLPAILGQEEFSIRVLILAVPYMLTGAFLLWVALKYMQVKSVKTLFNQVIGFGLLSLIHIIIFIICIIRIVGDPQHALPLLGKSLIQYIFMGLWLISLSSICFLFYRRFDGEVLEPNENDISLTERMIQEVKASKGKQAQGIIEIVGQGPAWIGKFWSDSIFFVVDNDHNSEEVYLLKKSDFKLTKCLTSRKKRTSGFLNVIFKINGEKYGGEISGESYHLYEKWKKI